MTSFNAKDAVLPTKSSRYGNESLQIYATNLSVASTFKKTNAIRRQKRVFNLSNVPMGHAHFCHFLYHAVDTVV